MVGWGASAEDGRRKVPADRHRAGLGQWSGWGGKTRANPEQRCTGVGGWGVGGEEEQEPQGDCVSLNRPENFSGVILQ